MILPMREKALEFDKTLTFRPTIFRRMGRGLIEGLRIILPMSFAIITGYFTVLEVMPFAEDEQWFSVLGMLALCGIVYGLISFGVIWLLKWLLIGRYKPRAQPMWTVFVWFSEAVTSMYESITVFNFMNFLRGTPLLPWAFRLMGVKIGKGVFLDTTDITEFDCVSIGDYAVLNARCGPQTHLFEDRIMKIGRVRIGNQVTVLPRSTILYDTWIGDGVYIGTLSLILKGEQLPARTSWVGTPAHSIIKTEQTHEHG
jgi:non-ribosomal peptide synthetase-like protein